MDNQQDTQSSSGEREVTALVMAPDDWAFEAMKDLLANPRVTHIAVKLLLLGGAAAELDENGGPTGALVGGTHENVVVHVTRVTSGERGLVWWGHEPGGATVAGRFAPDGPLRERQVTFTYNPPDS